MADAAISKCPRIARPLRNRFACWAPGGVFQSLFRGECFFSEPASPGAQKIELPTQVENKCTKSRFTGFTIVNPTVSTGNANQDALTTLMNGDADAMWVYADQAADLSAGQRASKSRSNN